MDNIKTCDYNLMLQMIKAIFFDWHGVLDKSSLEELLKEISKESGLSIDCIKDKFGSTARSYSLGYKEEREFWQFVQNETKLNDNKIHKLKFYINTIIKNDKLWRFLKGLESKYILGVLSDCPMEKVALIRKVNELDIFRKVYFSAEYHMDKKMPEFFDLPSKELKLRYEEILFVDDSLKNIEFARSLGFQTHLFTNNNKFVDLFQ